MTVTLPLWLIYLAEKSPLIAKLAESAFALIGHMFPNAGGDWTAGVALSGGDFKVQDTPDLIRKATTDFAYLDTWQATRLMRCYGTDVWHILHTDIEKKWDTFWQKVCLNQK